jgi:hypothetical protein
MTRATRPAAEQPLTRQTVRYSTPFHHSKGTNCAKLSNSVRPKRNLFAHLRICTLRGPGLRGARRQRKPCKCLSNATPILPPPPPGPVPFSPSGLSFLDKRRPAFSSSSYFLIVSSPFVGPCHLPLGSMYFLSCSRDGMFWLLYSTLYICSRRYILLNHFMLRTGTCPA